MPLGNNKEITEIYPSLSALTSEVPYSRKILSGLGKSTKRGMKKCYRCGIYNGTRSTMCKQCGVILKDSEEKSKVDLDAVKLLTGTEKQVYSVRVRDMGPDYRGFVQLPLLQLHSEDELNILSEMALCFVNSCQKSFDNSILKCHEEEQNQHKLVCGHIKSALKSQSTASPVQLKNETLNSIRIADDIKQQLLCLANDKDGVFVQRVSKDIMAVKCQVTPKHPLGYLHFTFVRGKGRDIYEKYYCSCTEFFASSSVRDRTITNKFKCLHYYACIWALASDDRYCEEFSYFIQSAQFTSNKQKLNRDVRKKLPSIEKDQIPKKRIFTESKIRDISRNIKKPKTTNMETLTKCKKILPKILPVEIKVLKLLNNDNESNSISWDFMDWLSYVTESINKTMQFENCGLINTLVFQIPQKFYEHLKRRIPNIYEESKLGDVCVYNIMNILHLKDIFDTAQIKLKISKKFVHIEQKGYVEDDGSVENNNSYNCSFIFFLNVGQSTVDESDNTNNSFIIEWLLPSLTSLTNIGQLKLQYKYGRKST